jgi:PAS domain S-box-containing protein
MRINKTSMQNNSKKELVSKALALTFAAVIFFCGVLFIVSWFRGWSYLLQLPPSIEMISFASSLNFIFIGLAIFSLFTPQSNNFAKFFGVLVLIVALSRIIEIIFNVRLDIADLFAPWIPLHVSAVQIPGASAVGFILIGLVLLCWSKDKRSTLQSTFIMLASLIVFLLGIFGSMSYIVPSRISFIWHGFALNFYAQLLAITIGAALVSAAYYYDSKFKVNVTNRLPITLTIILSAITILTTWKLALEKTRLVEDIIEARLHEITTKTNAKLEEHANLLKQFSSLKDLSKLHAFSTNSGEISSYLKSQDEILAIFWADTHGMIQAVIPQDKYKDQVHTLVPLPANVKIQFMNPMGPKKVYFTFSRESPPNLMMITSIFDKQSFEGLMSLLIDVNEFFASVTEKILENEFAITIYSGKEQIFSKNDQAIDDLQSWELRGILKHDNLKLNINMYPTQRFLDANINSTIIYLLLFGGTFIALSVGALTHFWQLTHAKILEAEKIKKKLIESEIELQSTLREAQIGTWSWDLKTDRIQMADYDHVLFGLMPGEFEMTFSEMMEKVFNEDREPLHLYLKNCIETDSLVNYTYRIACPDSSIHWLTSKGKFFYDSEGYPEKMVGITYDISAVKHALLLLEVSEAISKILSENGSLTETFDQFIQTLYHYLHWCIMVLWLLDPRTGQLKLIKLAHIPTIHIPEFKKATENLIAPESMSNIGHVLATSRPIWISDVSKDLNFARFEAAQKESIQGSFAFPILEGSRTIGILELYKRKPFEEEVDDEMLNLMTSIGIGTGQYLQRKIAEEARAELIAIVTNAQTGIYSLTLDGIIKSWNMGAENIYGWKASEAIGKPIDIIYPTELLNDLKQTLKKVSFGNRTEHFEIQCKRKDGSLIWIDKTIVIIKDHHENLMALASIDQDISKEKNIIEALDTNEKKFRDFVEATEEWFWEIDTDLNLSYSNPIIIKILGYSAEELMGKNLLNFLPIKAQKNFEEHINTCIRIREGWSKRETEWLHIDGSLRWLESNAHPIFDEKNQVIGFRGADRDITERKFMERSKNEFISMVNHELRSPLTSIIGALGLIRADAHLSEKIKILVNIAYRNSERLTAIINDIIDIEKIELGKMDFDIKPVSINELIDESINDSKPLAENFNIHLIKEGPLNNVNVMADPRRVIQILNNLISNAIKFSSSDSDVFISTKTLDQRLQVAIRDQGMGIPEDFKSKIFQKFAQADASDSRKVAGAGLGLNISKNLIEAMKGSIYFDSKIDEGSTFYFCLPISK